MRSSVKSSSTTNDKLIEQTIRLWEPRLQRELSREDARQMVENVSGFFRILAEWSNTETADAANDCCNPSRIVSDRQVSHGR